jgi:hypothetical protein
LLGRKNLFSRDRPQCKVINDFLFFARVES